jgi:predicted ATP-binding protein involved in virulence
MKIHQLEVKNFRGFEHQTFQFSDRFNLLIGDNGTGKTAVLDALAIAAGALFLGFDEVPSRNIRPDEVRRATYRKGQLPVVNAQYPVSITCRGIVIGTEMTWARSLNSPTGKTTRIQAKELEQIARNLQEEIRRGDSPLLPLIAYYGTGRLWMQKKEKVKTIKPGSPTLGYQDCTDPISNQKQLLEWFKTMEIASLQKQEPIQVLEAVKAAVSNCMEDWQQIYFDITEDTLVATSTDGRDLPFRMLSDGVRNMLAMVADIAKRSAVLNTHLGMDATKCTPGIVLIDEIDLHLHPKWQRRVVEDLKRTFPKIQFFATTHSPFMVQSLRPGELINLDRSTGEYYNKSIEDIVESVMGVDLPQHSQRWKDMMKAAEEYYRVLQEAQGANPEEIEKLKVKLDELSMPYSDDPAYQAFLKMERITTGL